LKDLKLNSTPKTPEINFDAKTGVLKIIGVSVPENPLEFYFPLIDWFKNYIISPAKETKLIFQLEYLNTSSIQRIYDVLSVLINNIDHSQLVIEWYYLEEDFDIKEMGEDFIEALEFPIKLIEVIEP